jgi:hypothetical protein
MIPAGFAMADWTTTATIVPPVLSGLGLLVSTSSLLVSGTNVARQAPGAFRRVSGYIVATLGGCALVASPTVWIVVRDFPVRRWTVLDTLLAGSAVLGLILLVGGGRRARNAPVDRDAEQLRALAEDMLSRVGDAEPASGPFGSARAELFAVGQGEPLTTLLRDAPDVITVLAGPAGSGKSTALRALARDICKIARTERSPGLMAVYVDLVALTASPSAPTAEQLHQYVLEQVTGTYPTMREKLDASLKGDDRARWLFLFDSLDEIAVAWPADQVAAVMREFLNEVRRFLRPGNVRFRAVIATRDSVPVPTGTRVTSIAALSRRAQRRLMSRASIESVDQVRALDRLRQSVGEIAGRPLVFQLWCEAMQSSARAAAPPVTSTNLHDFLMDTVGVRLGQDATVTPLPALALQLLAEDVAACMATEPSLAFTPSRERLVSALLQRGGRTVDEIRAGLHGLETAGLAVTGRPQTFAFIHHSFQDLFAANWLIRTIGTANFDAVLTDLRWRDSLTMAMQAGPDDFRVAVLDHAAALVSGLAKCLTVEIDEYLDVSPELPLPLVFDPTGPTPEIDPMLVHVLTLVAEVPTTSVALVPAALRETADRLAVTAFVRGDTTDQQAVFAVLKLMSPRVATWAIGRAVEHGDWLLETAALTTARMQRPITDLSVRSRLELTIGMFKRPFLVRQVATSPDAKVSPGTLPALMRDLVTALRVACMIIVGMSVISAASAAPRSAGATALAGALALVSVILLGLTFLGKDRQAAKPELSLGLVFLSVIAIMMTYAPLDAVGNLIRVLRGDPTAVRGLASDYLLTWPGLMVTALLLGPAPTRLDWLVPHRTAVRTVQTLWVVLPRQQVRRAATTTTTLIVILLAFEYLAGGPIPFVSGRTEIHARQIVASALLVACIAEFTRRWTRQQFHGLWGLRRSIADGTLTDEVLLGHLMVTGGGEYRMGLLVKELRKAPSEALRDCRGAIGDLVRALNHVDRMVPASTTTRIPRGIWDLEQRFTVTDFRSWLDDFDATHPGRLSWLAANYGDALARLAGALKPPASDLPAR